MLRVNDANLVATDIDTSNGVIHVIDKVLLPPPAGQTAARAAKELIASAINLGAPLYNSGRHSACAEVYMQTIDKLLQMENHGMDAMTVKTLQTAMRQATHSQSADAKAWTLRRALDAAYNSL
jgi:hypothetical protein